MSGDSILGWSRMFLPFTLIWILSSTTVECQECRTSGLNVFGGYQYVVYHSLDGIGRKFSETRAHCQSLGGDMPIITSAEQNTFIAMRLTEGDGNYYIGLEDMDDDGTYRWIDGTAPGYVSIIIVI
ncbi:uncharacterized protein LOC115926402 [Strongylocentrotus purpuratus]|uniref:C-type lectin domain-containing protein n=1 Tax=Strongylocentrotus purpuratus TaxID=7668 RepID=A0A7M7P8D7_STRPU|nr:uncharacterized protein LOC115926402 [Strongylocentrotus purpuratus]